MRFRFLLALPLTLLLSCSSDDENPSEGGDTPEQFISSYFLVDESRVDSLFYQNGKFKTLKEYVGGMNSGPNLDYTISFEHDEGGKLIEITRTQARETNPSTTINYSYNNDGTLSTKTVSTPFFESLITFSYEEKRIIINADSDSERRIYLNEDNQIEYVEEYGGPEDGFYRIKTYRYDEDSNISTILLTGRNGEVIFQYDLLYDSNPNPFQVFDAPLPNGLSIKMIEDAEQNSQNYFELPYSFSLQDAWGYFNKNNLVSCVVSGAENVTYQYQFQYDQNNFPTEAQFQFWNNTVMRITYME